MTDVAVAETHTGLVFLIGHTAYKVKKPVITDFLDFSTTARREQACVHEVELNRRLAPDSYLGVAHFVPPGGGEPEPVIVMRRHSDASRLATKARRKEPVESDLAAIAQILATFHAGARRSRDIDREARVEAVMGRWQENLSELARYAAGQVPTLSESDVAEVATLAARFAAGRAVLFAGRISDRRIVDGHADLLADDIFCLPEGPALLDCLEFDDRLRYVDVVDDAAFLAMDLEFLGRPDLADLFMRRYLQLTGDDAPASLRHFYIAYRAGVRAKVDCVRYLQGRNESAPDAARHLDIARDHLRRGAVRLILVGGGPGTGKTTLARALAERIGAVRISSDDTRAAMVARGELHGEPGTLGEGLYTAANVDAVYEALLREAHLGLCGGRSVVLDATWLDERHRARARAIAAQASSTILELACVAPPDVTEARILGRGPTTSQVTPDIAAAMVHHGDATWPEAHRIDTAKPLAESVAAAETVCDD